MSKLELEDVRIPGMTIVARIASTQAQTFQIEDSIADTTIWTGPRTLDHLVGFITEGAFAKTCCPPK